MRGDPCERCGGVTAHQPDCPEMGWLNDQTRRRGVLPESERLPIPPPYTGDPRKFRYANPGGISPLTRDLDTIFKGHTERMVARHIAEAKKAHADDDR